jgi:hypothetical protein
VVVGVMITTLTTEQQVLLTLAQAAVANLAAQLVLVAMVDLV